MVAHWATIFYFKAVLIFWFDSLFKNLRLTLDYINTLPNIFLSTSAAKK